MPNPLTKEAPYKGPGADSEEKHEPASDIDTALVDSLKVLDPEGPIREADIRKRRQARSGGRPVTPARSGRTGPAADQ